MYIFYLFVYSSNVELLRTIRKLIPHLNNRNVFIRIALLDKNNINKYKKELEKLKITCVPSLVIGNDVIVGINKIINTFSAIISPKHVSPQEQPQKEEDWKQFISKEFYNGFDVKTKTFNDKDIEDEDAPLDMKKINRQIQIRQEQKKNGNIISESSNSIEETPIITKGGDRIDEIATNRWMQNDF